MNKIRIGEYILSYRKERGMSQGEFGELLGVSAFAVSKWEREEGVPDIYILYKVAELYGVTVNDLLAPPVSFVKKINHHNGDLLSLFYFSIFL